MSTNRDLRGGSWLDDQLRARAACRAGYRPGYRNNFMGFRVACDVEPEPEREPSNVLRGGSWLGAQDLARAAARRHAPPDYRYDRVGFRVVCDSSNHLIWRHDAARQPQHPAPDPIE